jgi:Protein of unknown function (DUF2917)
MNSQDLRPGAIHLRKGEMLHLESRIGRRIESLRGSLWVTIDNDRRDIVVEPGAGFSVDRAGNALLSAMDDADFVLLEASTACLAASF